MAAYGLIGATVVAACTATSAGPAQTPTSASGSRPAQSPVPTTAPTATQTGRTPFKSSVRRLRPALKRTMRGVSWQPGCPVGLRRLRLLTVSHRTFRGDVRTGHLVAHRDAAADLVRAFRVMYRHNYPIRRMRLVEHYGGSDMRSITANNTSAFNCRAVPGSGTWSEHAYGRAVDINPVQNPYWHDGYVEPERGRKYLDRSRRHPAMIHEGDAVVRVFDRMGWGWGGRWQSLQDWQHFSVNGR